MENFIQTYNLGPPSIWTPTAEELKIFAARNEFGNINKKRKECNTIIVRKLVTNLVDECFSPDDDEECNFTAEHASKLIDKLIQEGLYKPFQNCSCIICSIEALEYRLEDHRIGVTKLIENALAYFHIPQKSDYYKVCGHHTPFYAGDRDQEVDEWANASLLAAAYRRLFSLARETNSSEEFSKRQSYEKSTCNQSTNTSEISEHESAKNPDLLLRESDMDITKFFLPDLD